MRHLVAIRRRLGDVDSVEWAAVLLMLVVCFFSFGLLLSRLGFFQDDWHHVFYAYWQGDAGLQRFLLADRGPFAWIVYALFFRLLGYSPAAWHWSLMLIRFATAVLLWKSLRQIWPTHTTLTAWLALIFALYPIFTLQPLSVAYTLHWLMYLVFMASLLLMLFAVRHPRQHIALTIVAVFLEAVHLAFIEYFSGLELSRLIFLWLVLSGLPVRERAKKIVTYAWPYLLVLILYVVYRSSYGAIFGYDRFTPLATLTDVLRAPLAGMLAIVQYMLQDIVYVVLSQWYAAVDPGIIDLSRPSTYLMLGAMIGFAALAYFVSAWIGRRRGEGGLGGQAAALAVGGVLSIILAMLPFWATGFSIYQKNLLWSERLALAAMPGASMLVVGTVYALIERDLHRHLILSVLVGLAVGLQVQTARSFQASWDKQLQFYWQLHWRAPALQPGTMLVSDQEILFYMGIYPTAFAINVLYPQVTAPPIASYWFNAGSEHVDFDKFAAGAPEAFKKYATTFTAKVQDVIAITFEPGDGQCLWILGPQHVDVRGLSSEASAWLSVSSPSRIAQGPETSPPAPIFGREPKHTWCYYFEKADLAGQYEQWPAVATLWDDSSRQGLRAANGVELLPFINAFARLGDWAKARQITVQAQALPDRSTSVLCDLWRSIDAATTSSAASDETVGQVMDQLGCQK